MIGQFVPIYFIFLFGSLLTCLRSPLFLFFTNIYFDNLRGFFSLFFFRSYGLEQRFKQDMYDDFEKLTLDTYHRGNLYGLEKYWYFSLSDIDLALFLLFSYFGDRSTIIATLSESVGVVD